MQKNIGFNFNVISDLLLLLKLLAYEHILLSSISFSHFPFPREQMFWFCCKYASVSFTFPCLHIECFLSFSANFLGFLSHLKRYISLVKTFFQPLDSSFARRTGGFLMCAFNITAITFRTAIYLTIVFGEYQFQTSFIPLLDITNFPT